MQQSLIAEKVDIIRKRKRDSMAKYRLENPEKSRLRQKAWRDENIVVCREKERKYYGRRFFWGKAQKLKGEGRATYKEIASLWRRQNGFCALTGRSLSRTAQLDHILPRAKGGGDCLTNLRWVCSAANLLKRDLLDADLLELCLDIIKTISPVPYL